MSSNGLLSTHGHPHNHTHSTIAHLNAVGHLNSNIATAAPTETNATSSSSLTYLQCPLCLDDFSASNTKLQPRLLPSCAHSLCTRCLHQQWAIQASEMAHPTFLCPIDAHPVRVTQVEDIPVNKILIGLISMMSSTPESESAFRIGSYARAKCVEESCGLDAVWHCFSDEADMCELHKQQSHDGLKSNITKNHRLCRMEEKESKKGPSMCALHHSALLLWCVECKTHACHACATLPPHSSHPDALKLLGQHLSNASLGGLAFLELQGKSSTEGFYSDQQLMLVRNIVEEEKKMKNAMEKEAKELVQTLQVIDSNELHTRQALDMEFSSLLHALEERRTHMHEALSKQVQEARLELDARMLQLSLNHSLTNTVLEESERISKMNPYTLISYMNNLCIRHEKSLEKYWEYAYAESLITWFPLRLGGKEVLLKDILSLGSIGVPQAPMFKLEECIVDDTGVELSWTEVGGMANNNESEKSIRSGKGYLAASSPTNASQAQSPSISFYILHMSPLDPFDLSQDSVAFQEVYRGPSTSFSVQNLTPGGSYLFRVQAVSLMGEGAWSQRVCITTNNAVQGRDQQQNGFGHSAQIQPLSARGGAQRFHQQQQQQLQHQREQSDSSYQTPYHQQQPNHHSQHLQHVGQGGQHQPYQIQVTGAGVPTSSPTHSHQNSQSHPYSQQVSLHPSPKHTGSSSSGLQSPYARHLGASGQQGSVPASGMHSLLPSRRGSFTPASPSHGQGGPMPFGALRQSLHPQAHPPSVRTGWEDLWKLSVILREKDTPALMRFFHPVGVSSFQLLYRSTRDGFSTQSYHNHVDSMGPTLTVIRVKTNGRDYVFGGFADQSWSSGGGEMMKQGHWVSSNHTWMFSLINAYKRNFKFRIKKGQEKFAMHCDARHAAMFGVGGDLTLLDPLDAPQHHFGLDSYELDTECDSRSGLPRFSLPLSSNGVFSSTMLSGGETFQCKEVECYAVNIE